MEKVLFSDQLRVKPNRNVYCPWLASFNRVTHFDSDYSNNYLEFLFKFLYIALCMNLSTPAFKNNNKEY